MEKIMEKLGKEARDKITGFKGIIIGCCTYLYGCNQYGLAAKVGSDGKVGEACWFDEGRIEIIGDGVKPSSVMSDKNGGDNLRGPNNYIR